MPRWNDLSKPAHADEWADEGMQVERPDYLEQEERDIQSDNEMDYDYDDWN